jgi:hypothetical protein
MNWRDLIPFLGWQPLTPAGALELDLDPSAAWEALVLQWLGRGMVICARPC